MPSIIPCALLLAICLTGVYNISISDMYLSDKQTARRRGILNVRFRPVMHLRGDDDWRKQIGIKTLSNQMMDENGIVYYLRPTRSDRIFAIFNPPSNFD